MGIKRRLIIAIIAALTLAGQPRTNLSEDDDRRRALSVALQDGAADIESYPAFGGEFARLLETLGRLSPGIVNNTAYFWQDLSQTRVDQAGARLREIKQIPPRTLVVAS